MVPITTSSVDHNMGSVRGTLLSEVLPSNMTVRLRQEISSYTQLDTEALFEAWERLKGHLL